MVWNANWVRAAIAVLALAAAAGCMRDVGGVHMGVPSPVPDGPATDGVTNDDLARLLHDHWEWRMRRSPTWATRLGDHRFDHEIGDNSPQAIAQERRERRAFLERAEGLDASRMTERDRVTVRLFRESLRRGIESDACDFHQWNILPRSNPVTRWNDLADAHRVETVADGRNLVRRFRAVPVHIRHEIGHLRAGAEKGLFANAESVRRVITMVETQLAEPVDEWPMMDPAEPDRPEWDPRDLSLFRSDLRRAIAGPGGVREALEDYRAFLRAEILPHARPQEESGLAHLPDGRECYATQVRRFTTLDDMTAERLHEIGLAEVEKIDAEMRVLGEALFETQDLTEIHARLRDDAELHFDTADEIVAKAESALARARDAMPEWFGILPEADCVVTEIPAYEAPFTTIAYYRRPSPDSPGRYYVNTYKPETRPRYEAEALAWHEAIPGHHLQIAIAQELPALPAFRKYGGFTAFVEGWALYTERLADEMGLYSGDLDRMGMLSYDAWRACRLVVDTGLHHHGWSREQAVQFMLEHTALAENNIRNEVDRYITWPGQALAYKTGQLEILRLRTEAREALGEAFDIREFHDVVLGRGAVSLPVLRDRVEAWIESAQR